MTEPGVCPTCSGPAVMADPGVIGSDPEFDNPPEYRAACPNCGHSAGEGCGCPKGEWAEQHLDELSVSSAPERIDA